MNIKTGRYFIINVQTKNLVYLRNANSGEPVQARYQQDDPGEQWDIIDRKNGHHSILNVRYRQYAVSGSRSKVEDQVIGEEGDQTWLIKTSGKGQYTISTTDSNQFLGWGLADNQQGTPITLADGPTNHRNWWMFKEVGTGKYIEVDLDLDNGVTASHTTAGDTTPRAVFLLELALPPVSPSELFELDLVIIQEMPYNRDFIRNVIETANKICRPLIKSKQLKPSNLLIQVIEFESYQLAHRFRYSGPDSFDNLRRYRGVDFPWTECSGPVIPSFLTKAMNGLRSSATKVVVLNLRYIPLQNGRQERLRELIERMIEKDVILILTLSEPHQFDTLFHTDLFQQLAGFSSGSILSLPTDEGGFYPLIVDYLQHFDVDSITKKNCNVVTIYPEIHLSQQPKRPDEPEIYISDGTLKPAEVIQGGPTQSWTSLLSVASPPGSSQPGEMIQGRPSSSSTSLAPSPGSLDSVDVDIAIENGGRPNTIGTNAQGHTLSSAALDLQTRFEQQGAANDIDEAISYHQETLEHLPSPQSNRSSSFQSDAAALYTRFRQQGTSDDLDQAIVLYRKALNLRPAPHPDRFESLKYLAAALETRHQWRATFDNLNELITLYNEALDLHPAPHPHHSSSLDSLAIALYNRFRQEGVPDDLDEAIVLHRKALELRSAPHPDRSSSLHNLAVALQTRLRQQGASNDLDEAITLYREALDLRSASHPDRSTSLHNLAAALVTRFRQQGTSNDLDKAIALYREALVLQPAPHRDRISSLRNLAAALQIRFTQQGDKKDHKAAKSSLREAEVLASRASRRPDQCVCQ